VALTLALQKASISPIHATPDDHADGNITREQEHARDTTPEVQMPAANAADDTTGQPETAEQKAERDTQREGRWALVAGISLGVLDVVGASIFRASLDRDLPYELFVAAMGCATLAIAHGVRERANRPFRQVIRHVLRRLDEVEQAVAKVPDYGLGVIDGVEMSKRVAAEHD
jgi:hypothetical protein